MERCTVISEGLLTKLKEIYPKCIFEEQARRSLAKYGFNVAKTTWQEWKNKGSDLLYLEEEREYNDFEKLVIDFFLTLNNIGADIDQSCLDVINTQKNNPKNAEFAFRILKIRNRGEYDEKTIVENNVSGNINLNVSLLDAIKQAKLNEKDNDNKTS